MTAPRVLAEIGQNSGWFAGDMGIIHAAVKTVGCPKMYDRRRRAISVPRQHADDVTAALELQFGADVEVVEAIL